MKDGLHVKHNTWWWGKCEYTEDAYSNASISTDHIMTVNPL
ncbi:hypothetical protein GYH30_004658 [Glycine max]|nr:hypothetical protein GYH30_004658 [Glycine max]